MSDRFSWSGYSSRRIVSVCLSLFVGLSVCAFVYRVRSDAFKVQPQPFWLNEFFSTEVDRADVHPVDLYEAF